jgi:hypothetical protein
MRWEICVPSFNPRREVVAVQPAAKAPVRTEIALSLACRGVRRVSRLCRQEEALERRTR